MSARTKPRDPTSYQDVSDTLPARTSAVLATAIHAIEQALEYVQRAKVTPMSFSLSVPAGPASEFADRAAKAKADLEAGSENNDYALTQLASETADATIKAATDLVAALGDGGTASATLSGHHSTDGVTACTASVAVTVTPAPAAHES